MVFAFDEYVLGADYVRRAGSVCRDLGTSVKHTKNQLCDYMEKSQPGFGWDPGIAMPGSQLAGLKIYHVIVIAGPARLAGLTLFRH